MSSAAAAKLISRRTKDNRLVNESIDSRLFGGIPVVRSILRPGSVYLDTVETGRAVLTIRTTPDIPRHGQ